MKRIAAVLAVCAILQATAFANMVTFDSQLTSAVGDCTLTTTVSGATVYDFDSLTPSITGNYAVVSGSILNTYSAPYCVGEGYDTTKYLTVPKMSNGNNSATISFGQDYNYLGFFWGSIDTFNTITFYDNGVVVASYSGAAIIEPDSLTGNQTNEETNKYVNFFLDSSFDTVVLSSTNYAFELDNIAVATVPVPGAVLLGFLGLSAAGLRLRKRA